MGPAIRSNRETPFLKQSRISCGKEGSRRSPVFFGCMVGIRGVLLFSSAQRWNKRKMAMLNTETVWLVHLTESPSEISFK